MLSDKPFRKEDLDLYLKELAKEFIFCLFIRRHRHCPFSGGMMGFGLKHVDSLLQNTGGLLLCVVIKRDKVKAIRRSTGRIIQHEDLPKKVSEKCGHTQP
jgi:hypothetical protein